MLPVSLKSLGVAILLLFEFIPLFSQKTYGDSLAMPADSLRIFQNRQSVPLNGLGYYAATATDRVGLQIYAGLNAMNMLRGHVPNLYIDGKVTVDFSSRLRNSNTMFIIDGVPFTYAMNDYFNLNSFEFQSVGAISSGNGLALYGGVGSNGAFILESKTGRGFTKPQFEFNSFSTFGRFGGTERFLEVMDEWMFTNSIAYAQDFGVVDTRISYSNSFQPEGVTNSYTSSVRNALKVNTGFEINRFTARLSGDLWAFETLANDDRGIDHNRNNLNGNLLMQFRATS